MYTYKRFRTSKSAVTIILIILALVAWEILGLTGTPLAKKGKGKETATFEISYIEDSALAFVPQPLPISCPIPPGSTQIGDHGVVLDLSAFGEYTVSLEAKGPGPLLLIEQDQQDVSEAHVSYWFTDAGSGVQYQLEMLGMFVPNPDNWLPAPGSTATVAAAEGDNWTLSPLKGKRKEVHTETGELNWTLEITRPD